MYGPSSKVSQVMVSRNLHHISATVMWSSGNKSITYLQTAHVWNHILQLLIWVYYWITVCKYLIWYSHMIVMWFVNMWFNVYHLSFAGGCLYNSAEWALSFCSADTTANCKDLFLLQFDLPLVLCECPTVIGWFS